jgi:glycosyltransferase involved in cell wall biosynthesis
MPRFSLVTATLGRTNELSELLTSILNQKRADIEIILVDQNEDDRVSDVVSAFQGKLNILHLRVDEKNVSEARNTGMDAATGEIIAFPDDDCWYPEDLLNQVDSWFRTNSQYSVLAVGALDNEGSSSGNRWFQDACDIRSWNVLRTTFCSSLFISAVERSRGVRFNRRLSRGEETDFILRLLATGLHGRFDRTLHIHHPKRDMLSGTVSKERARDYGAGMGNLVRQHSLFVLWAGLLGYDLARALFVSLIGKFDDAVFCFAHAEGLFQGFVFPEKTYD